MVSSTTLPTKECNNLTSARTQPEIVSSLLREECDKGYAYGPFLDAPFDCYRISPIGVATGKYSGKKRLIIDLSAPHNDSDILASMILLTKKNAVSHMLNWMMQLRKFLNWELELQMYAM